MFTSWHRDSLRHLAMSLEWDEQYVCLVGGKAVDLWFLVRANKVITANIARSTNYPTVFPYLPLNAT